MRCARCARCVGGGHCVSLLSLFSPLSPAPCPFYLAHPVQAGPLQAGRRKRVVVDPKPEGRPVHAVRRVVAQAAPQVGAVCQPQLRLLARRVHKVDAPEPFPRVGRLGHDEDLVGKLEFGVPLDGEEEAPGTARIENAARVGHGRIFGHAKQVVEREGPRQARAGGAVVDGVRRVDELKQEAAAGAEREVGRLGELAVDERVVCAVEAVGRSLHAPSRRPRGAGRGRTGGRAGAAAGCARVGGRQRGGAGHVAPGPRQDCQPPDGRGRRGRVLGRGGRPCREGLEAGRARAPVPCLPLPLPLPFPLLFGAGAATRRGRGRGGRGALPALLRLLLRLLLARPPSGRPGVLLLPLPLRLRVHGVPVRPERGVKLGHLGGRDVPQRRRRAARPEARPPGVARREGRPQAHVPADRGAPAARGDARVGGFGQGGEGGGGGGGGVLVSCARVCVTGGDESV